MKTEKKNKQKTKTSRNVLLYCFLLNYNSAKQHIQQFASSVSEQSTPIQRNLECIQNEFTLKAVIVSFLAKEGKASLNSYPIFPSDILWYKMLRYFIVNSNLIMIRWEKWGNNSQKSIGPGRVQLFLRIHLFQTLEQI